MNKGSDRKNNKLNNHTVIGLGTLITANYAAAAYILHGLDSIFSQFFFNCSKCYVNVSELFFCKYD